MNERRLKIIEMLREAGSIEVAALSRKLNVSGVTVRKDLAFLEENGLLRRTHGFAEPVSNDDVGYRMLLNYDIKKRIAIGAADMVENGETVMIESGSTCAMLARELAERKRDVTIITNSAFIAEHIRFYKIKIILLGGSYAPDAQVMTGPLINKYAKEFFVDKFFIGIDGFDVETGFSNVDLLRAEAVRAMAESARRLILLTDSSKFNRRGVVLLMPAKDVSAVVTDALPENCRENLEKNKVEIIIV